jgi:predicted DNA binding CopG/RHH family protein
MSDSDSEYDSQGYEVPTDESVSKSYDSEEEVNENLIDLGDVVDNSDESSESSDEELKLKTTMIFPKKGQAAKPIKELIPIPRLPGMNLSKQTVEPPKKLTKVYNTEEIEEIIKQMPGINLSNKLVNYEREDITDLLEKEAQESVKDFNVRKEITIKISNIEKVEIKNSTSVVLGLMIAKKLRFGIKYDENGEVLIKDILAMLS